MPSISSCFPFFSRPARQPASPAAHPPVAVPPASAAAHPPVTVPPAPAIPARQPASHAAARLATTSPERHTQPTRDIRHVPSDDVLRRHAQDQLLLYRDLSRSYLKQTLLRPTSALPNLSQEEKETIIIQLYRMTTQGTESETTLTKFVLNRVYDCFSFFNRYDPSPRTQERPSPSFESRAKAQHIRLRTLLTHIRTSQDQLTVETPYGFRIDSKEEGQHVVVACHMRFYVTTQNGDQHHHTPTEWLTYMSVSDFNTLNQLIQNTGQASQLAPLSRFQSPFERYSTDYQTTANPTQKVDPAALSACVTKAQASTNLVYASQSIRGLLRLCQIPSEAGGQYLPHCVGLRSPALPPLPSLANLPEIWRDDHMYSTAHSLTFLGEQIDQASVTNWRITFECPQRRAIFHHNQSPELDGFSVVQCELRVYENAESRGNRSPISELVGCTTVYVILSPTQLQSFVAAYGALVVDRANPTEDNQTQRPRQILASSQQAGPARHAGGIAGGAAAGSGAVNPSGHRAATEAEIGSRIENCYELFCKEIKQIGHFSHLTVEMLRQCIKITHHGPEGWAFTYPITDHSSLERIAMAYALHNLLNHALSTTDKLDLQAKRRISHDGFMRLITQLESPAYKEAKRRLEFISNQPLETGHKSWWEVIQAETALREQGQPGRLAASLYEALHQRPEAELKASSVPLLHTALLDLEHHEDRESWKKWLELLFVNLGFKDNKGRDKTFLTGNEEWRTILSEDQAQKISHYTDHILWVIAQLKETLSFDGSVTALYNRLCEMGLTAQHTTDDTMIGALKAYYDAQLNHHYLPFESPSVRSKGYIQTLATTLQAKARPTQPEPTVDPSTPAWDISFNTFKSMLDDPLDEALGRATQRFQVHIRENVQHSRDIPHMLHALVSKLREIKANSDPQYADAITALRIKIKRFNEGDPGGRSDMEGRICLTGIWGRLESLLETLSVGDQLNAFVTTQLSQRLKEKLSQNRGRLGGDGENSMHPNFMATFLADRGWGRRPLDPMPFPLYRESFNRIATETWRNNTWVTTTLLSGVYDYYEQKITTLLRETQAIEPLLSILQQIDPTFESSRLSTMYYPNNNPEDYTPNPAALMGFVLEHIEDIAIREGFVERLPQ